MRHTASPDPRAPAARALSAGDQLLAGRYQIRRKLGEGGMGIVYEAFDTQAEASVALKTLSRVDAGGIYRLKGEFRSLGGVVHPNLVRLHHLHADGESWFFTMSLVSGRPFLDHVREDSAVGFENTVPASSPGGATEETIRVPVIAQQKSGATFRERTLRECLAELALGVDAIHRAGKLHRDLKPSNVLVTQAGRVVILDFGLVSENPARAGAAIGRTQLEEGITGTPAYMAPEQCAGEPATTASDWYGVGVMLFQALTGELPFEGTVLQILTRKQSADAPAAAERDFRSRSSGSSSPWSMAMRQSIAARSNASSKTVLAASHSREPHRGRCRRTRRRRIALPRRSHANAAREPARGTAGRAGTRGVPDRSLPRCTRPPRQEPPRVPARLRDALEHFGAGSTVGYLAAAQWRLGQILGGDEGAALCDTALSWARDQGVVRPEKFLGMYAPGFERWGVPRLPAASGARGGGRETP